MISFGYDKEGDIFEIKFSDKEIKSSEYIKDSSIVIDYDEDEKIVSLEVLTFSERVGKDRFADSLAV